MKTIYVLWLRQLKRYFRSPPRVIGSLGQPLLFLLALGFGFGPVFKHAGQGNYIEFLAPGIIAMSIIFTALFSGIEVIWDRQFGFLKETLVAPVSRLNIMIGRTLGGATVATVQGVIVLFIALAPGFRPANWALVPVALVAMAITALLFTALGTALASLLNDMQGFQLIMPFLVMPLFFLSGALFPLQGAPGAITAIARCNPLSYGVDALRGLLTGASHYGLLPDFAVLAAVTTLFLLAGSWFFSRVEA